MKISKKNILLKRPRKGVNKMMQLYQNTKKGDVRKANKSRTVSFSLRNYDTSVIERGHHQRAVIA
jgi:hypothetical protein